MDTTENINDDRVKGHCIQITDEDENWKTIEHFGSNLFYYSVKAISAISAPSYSDPSAYVDQLYAVCNPETQSYDIYNAATGEYHDYRLDEVPSCFRNSNGDSAGVFRIVKNKKIGIMAADGTLLYQAVYDDISNRSYESGFPDGSLDSLPYSIFLANKDGLRGFVDSLGLSDGTYVAYSSYVNGYAIKLECPDTNPSTSYAAENSTVTCSLVDTKGETVLKLPDNANRTAIEGVRDGIVFPGDTGSTHDKVLIYDTEDNSVVLEEPNAYFPETDFDLTTNIGGHLFLLYSPDVDSYALFNSFNRTFSGWNFLDHSTTNDFENIPESIVGSDMVFPFNGTLYNGSFQPVGQLEYPDFVTKKGNFVFTRNNSMEEGTYEVFDRKGSPILQYEIPVNTDYSDPSIYSLLTVRESGNSLWGYCDEDGMMQIEPQFTNANRMILGLAKAADDSGAGIVDQNGNSEGKRRLQSHAQHTV